MLLSETFGFDDRRRLTHQNTNTPITMNSTNATTPIMTIVVGRPIIVDFERVTFTVSFNENAGALVDGSVSPNVVDNSLPVVTPKPIVANVGRCRVSDIVRVDDGRIADVDNPSVVGVVNGLIVDVVTDDVNVVDGVVSSVNVQRFMLRQSFVHVDPPPPTNPLLHNIHPTTEQHLAAFDPPH